MDSVKLAIAKRRNVIEEVVMISGLIGVQFIHAGLSVISSYLMSLGLHPYSLIVYSTFFAFLFLTPISLIFERKLWPEKFTFKFVIQLILIAFAGITLFQSLLLQGLKKTSPAMSTAMLNLTPASIFLIAWVFRLEKVNVGCLYSKVKVLGTLLCVLGAVVMSILLSATTRSTDDQETPLSSPSPPGNTSDLEKVIGCLYLIAAVFALSGNIVLQAHTLGDFPAPISLSALQFLVGMILTALAELCQDHKFDIGWPALSIGILIGFTLLMGMINGMAVGFTTWAMKKRGPVLVSMFGPIATIASATLSVITLGDTINIQSIPGMLLMFTGLYLVLWAKGKEGYNTKSEAVENEKDVEKPLLAS
ncbi:hypothetical protein Dimus_008943 [Dionaea muscipula]